ncbi:hypothetical protein IPC411_27945 [Pseudomonas aeruginosa]|nr:hypothetical protein IPC411_27945 [Pseudomonas aeruginosa]
MFENVASCTARILYSLIMGLGVLLFAWTCLANLPLWGAALAFCLGLPLLALVATPIAAGGSLLMGVTAGLVVTGFAFLRRPRCDG